MRHASAQKAASGATGTMILLLTIALLFVSLLLSADAGARDNSLQYADLEFYGSSLITRREIEGILRLKPGRPMSQVERAADRLRKDLDKRRLLSNVQVIVVGRQRIYVVVDVEDKSNLIPTRSLIQPHHVLVKSQKPEILLQALRQRLERLRSEGREWQETYTGGVRQFSDEPARQIATQIRRFGPSMREEWLTIVREDPDPVRRCDAIELLNWAGHNVQTCTALVPALDDMSYLVRTSAVRFLYPRLKLLNNSFPFADCAAALCRELYRPSHQDRVRSLHCIRELLSVQPGLTPAMARCANKRVEELAERSRIPTLRKAASDLLTVFSTYKPPPPRPRRVPDAGF